MKMRIILSLLLIALLLLSASASALSAPPRYRVETGILAGKSYPPARTGVQAGAISVGGAYRLATRSAPGVQAGSGCCCTWLPCVLKHP